VFIVRRFSFTLTANRRLPPSWRGYGVYYPIASINPNAHTDVSISIAFVYLSLCSQKISSSNVYLFLDVNFISIVSSYFHFQVACILRGYGSIYQLRLLS